MDHDTTELENAGNDEISLPLSLSQSNSHINTLSINFDRYKQWQSARQ